MLRTEARDTELAATPWLGRRDSNPQYQSQSLVCYRYTTSHRVKLKGLGLLPIPSCGVGKGARTLGTRNHNPVLCQLSYTPQIARMARQEGFEPPAYCLEGSCSIQLSYWRICATAFSCCMLERVMGIEPTYPAWKAGVLPLNYTRKGCPSDNSAYRI